MRDSRCQLGRHSAGGRTTFDQITVDPSRTAEIALSLVPLCFVQEGQYHVRIGSERPFKSGDFAAIISTKATSARQIEPNRRRAGVRIRGALQIRPCFLGVSFGQSPASEGIQRPSVRRISGDDRGKSSPFILTAPG